MPTEERLFATTRWDVVLNAADTGAPLAAEALNQLCGAYWKPLYVFVRRVADELAYAASEDSASKGSQSGDAPGRMLGLDSERMAAIVTRTQQDLVRTPQEPTPMAFTIRGSDDFSCALDSNRRQRRRSHSVYSAMKLARSITLPTRARISWA